MAKLVFGLNQSLRPHGHLSKRVCISPLARVTSYLKGHGRRMVGFNIRLHSLLFVYFHVVQFCVYTILRMSYE
jgi:hypothetical protein